MTTTPEWGSPGELPAGPIMRAIEILSDILTLLAGSDDSPGSDESGAGTGCELEPFCRVAVYPGPDVPWDSCSTGGACGEADGQLWAALQPITRIPTSDAGNGSCGAYQFTAQIGAVRCAEGKLRDDDLNPLPSVDAVQNDAIRQARDADAIRWALQCCPDRPQRMKDAGIVLDSWTPLASADCVGGQWTIRGRFDVCC